MKTLEPRYDLTSRTHITSTLIPNMYAKTRESVMKQLQESEFIALTTDGWTSRAAKSFITVTAHTISKDWVMKEFVLCTEEMAESHNANNLAEQLRRVARDWNIKLSDTIVTTDNASNVVLAMEKCNLLCHVRCMAHVLNLSTQKGLKVNSLQRLLGRVRSVVGFFHRSAIASAILLKTLAQLELPQLKPVLDVSTRWNSTFDMLQRYIVIRPAILVALNHKDLRNNAQKDTLNSQDVSDIEAVRDMLEIMKTSTNVLSSSTHATASLILPTKHTIITQLKESCTDDNDSALVREVKCTIRNDLENRYVIHFEYSSAISNCM